MVYPSFVFDEKNWYSQKSYQYPSAWSGEAFLRIVEKVKEEFGLNISKFFLFGFSAGAQFSLRFALWKPELCAEVSAHAGGGIVIPEKFVDVKFFVSIGRDDTRRIEIVDNFYKKAKELGIDVTYNKVSIRTCTSHKPDPRLPRIFQKGEKFTESNLSHGLRKRKRALT